MRRLIPFFVIIPNTQAAGLNDTGITFCGDASSNSAICSAAAADSGGYPRQDARYGRDAAVSAKAIAKIGGGEAGFDFTALNVSGQVTTPTSGVTPHPCVRDNITGLIWEVKTADGGLRDQKWTYTWYDSVHNYGGTAGTESGTINCKNAGRCDTEKYVADVNAIALCGYVDWRMPTRKELQSIVHYGRANPSIDSTYFLNTPNSVFWSGSPNAYYSSYAWVISFGDGQAGSGNIVHSNSVRLVRSEP